MARLQAGANFAAGVPEGKNINGMRRDTIVQITAVRLNREEIQLVVDTNTV